MFMSSLLIVLTLPAGSQSPTKAEPAEVERLIRQLGGDSFAEREAASRALAAIGEPVLETLRKAAREDRDTEVRRHEHQPPTRRGGVCCAG
jgi:hypothetical protein